LIRRKIHKPQYPPGLSLLQQASDCFKNGSPIIYNSMSMNAALQPICLFADSQLLFWRDEGALFLDRVRALMTRARPKAAYVGASNGDDPQFYSIFEAAMENIGIQDCRMILSSFPSGDKQFIADADIILLAGGDVEKGWNVLNEVGLKESIIKRYHEGALLIGISAGAVQLGLFGLVQEDGSVNKLIDTAGLVPFIISAHEERDEWRDLKEAIQLLNGGANGVGIPAGGGLIYHADETIEAIRYPLVELTVRNGVISQNLLMPQAPMNG
jgi:cyanophycinase